MKNLPLQAAAVLLLGVWACQNTDPQLTDNIQEQIETVESMMDDMEGGGQSIDMLATQMQQAPIELKTDTASNFVQLNDDIATLQDRFYQRAESISSLLASLRTLSDQYASGKINTAAAKKEYDLMALQLQQLQAAAAAEQEDFDKASAGFGRMMADFKAKIETE